MEADLLAAIYAAPDDDAPRLVYADWLLDRGDTLGELIALQVKGVKSRRVEELLYEHFARALGTFASQVSNTTFERGFPAQTAPRADADPSDPRWATIHTISTTAMLDDAAPLPWLRRLVRLTDESVAGLARLTRPLAIHTLEWHLADELGAGGNTRWGRGGPGAAMEVLRKLAIVPHLRRLELIDRRTQVAPRDRGWERVEDLPWLFDAPWSPHLAELVVDGTDFSYLHEWIARFGPTAVQRLELVQADRHPWRVVVLRDVAGFLTQLEIYTPWPEPDPTGFVPFGEALLAGLGAMSRLQLTTARIYVPEQVFDPAKRHANETFARALKGLERKLQTQAKIEHVELRSV